MFGPERPKNSLETKGPEKPIVPEYPESRGIIGQGSVYPGYILHPESIPKISTSSGRSACQQFRTCRVYLGYDIL